MKEYKMKKIKKTTIIFLAGLFLIGFFIPFGNGSEGLYNKLINDYPYDFQKDKSSDNNLPIKIEELNAKGLLENTDRACDMTPPFSENFESYPLGLNLCWKNAILPTANVIAYNPTDTSSVLRYDTTYRYDTSYTIGSILRYFNYTGSPQTWTVPANVTTVGLSVWGAQGGDGGKGTYTAGVGGNGGYAAGTLSVSPGDILTIIVGGMGQSAASHPTCPTCPGGNGGYGSGGGAGGAWCSSQYAAGGGGGGGFSMIQKNGTMVLVAGGGGGGGGGASSGGSNHGAGGNGGAGGGLSGINGSPSSGGGYNGYGGTQYSGGSGGSSGQSGGYLYGGGGYGYSSAAASGNSSTYAGGTGASGGCSSSAGGSGGGGGGYYGGGGGGSYSAGGGGGSAYVGGVANGVTIAGNLSIPDTNGQTMVGKMGYGCAGIAYQGTVMDGIDTLIDQIYVAETLIVYHSNALLIEEMQSNSMVVSPKIIVTPNEIVNVSFAVFSDVTESVQIGMMPDQSTLNGFIEFQTITTQAGVWKPINLTNIPISTTHKHLAFRTSGQNKVYVDQVFISATQNPTSIQELSTLECQISPNPFNDKLYLSSTSISGDVMVRLFDIQGREIYATQLNGFSQYSEIKIPEINSGIYVIKIEDLNQRTYNQKIIKY